MGIDHGLEGRNSEQSRQRRERKALRVKKMVKKLLAEGDAGGRRNEIKFDEGARTAWLTGFHKRKQERRKYGLTMQVLKEQKLRKEAQKSRIQTLEKLNTEASEAKLKKVKLGAQDSDDEDEDNGEGEVAPENPEDHPSIFNDEATLAMFGSAVSVVVDENPVVNQFSVEDFDDNASVASLRSLKSSKNQNKAPQLSRFDRAMKKVKDDISSGKLARKNNKRPNLFHAKEQAKKSGHALQKKGTETKKLFEKAMGRKMKKGRGKK